ncbi:MAG TPA: LCP family protein [Kineosporiaceae bacterium]|nr:LCP family protein [Kineosporiaceae bacterium]
MTQLTSPSSRQGQPGPNPRYAVHHGLGEPDGDLSDEDARGRHATPRGQGFGRVIGWTLLGSLIPGSGLIAAGRRGFGGFVLTVTVLLGLAAAGAALVIKPTEFVASLIGSPDKIVMLAAGMLALVLGWVVVVLATHASARQYSNLTRGQRFLATLLVLAILGAAVVPTAYVAQNALLARDTLLTMFKSSGAPLNKDAKGPDSSKADPWADTPRVNVLLMGGDSGLDRIGIRPDTMIVASIDTHTGDTVLISLPRNLQRVPFSPKRKAARAMFPNGFYCFNTSANANTECLLNALWTWGDQHASYFQDSKTPGLTATVEGIEQLTGLSMDQYVMLNLRGFEDFIDAIGGLDINVKQKLPVGGNVEHPVASAWLKPGMQHLNGYYSLWYARSRWSTDDFDRIRRQRCVIGAVVQQANPVSLALGFSAIMKTLAKNFLTSIPLKDVDAWVVLAERVKKSKVRSLAFTNQLIDTTRPDTDKMHELVQEAINAPASANSTPTTTPTPTATATASPGKKKPTTKTTPAPTKPVDSSAATDLQSVC